MYINISALMFASSLVLAACGNYSESTESVPANETEKVDEVAKAKEEEVLVEGEDERYEFNEVLADNDNIYVEIINVSKVYDDNSDEEAIGAVFKVENKTDRNLEVQSRSVSIDDRMVDDSLPELSQNVAAGKKAEVVLTLYSYDGSVTIPDLENNFEMVLHFFDWDDMDFSEDVDVYVEF